MSVNFATKPLINSITPSSLADHADKQSSEGVTLIRGLLFFENVKIILRNISLKSLRKNWKKILTSTTTLFYIRRGTKKFSIDLKINKISILYIPNQNFPKLRKVMLNLESATRIANIIRENSIFCEKNHVETFAECTGIACTFTESLASSRREAGTSRWRGWEVEAYEWTVPYDSVSEWRRTELLAHVWASCVGGLRGRNKEENIAEWRNKREGGYVAYTKEKKIVARFRTRTERSFFLRIVVHASIVSSGMRFVAKRHATRQTVGRFPEICIFRISFLSFC